MPLRRDLALPALLVALAGAYAGVLVYFVRCGRLNHDEGWYLYAARLVYQGNLPYRDFAFFQAPLLPYVYGVPQMAFGGGIEIGRWTSAALSTVTATFGAFLCWRNGGAFAAVFFLAALTSTPAEMWSFATTRTEPLTTPLLMLTAYCLLRRPFESRAGAAAALFATLAAATRVSMVPLALGVAFVVARRCGLRQALVALAPAGAVTLAAAGITFGYDPTAAWFDLITSQTERHEQFGPAPPWGILDHFTVQARALTTLPNWYGFVPITGVVLAALGIGAARTWSGFTALRPTVVVLGGLAAAAYLPNLLPRALHFEYFAPAFPLLLALSACVLGSAFHGWSRRAGGFTAAALLVWQGALFAAQLDAHTSAAEPDLEELHEVAAYLRENVSRDSHVVTMSSYLAVESGLYLLPGWEMDIFAYHPLLQDEKARRVRVVGAGGLEASLKNPSVGAVVASDIELGIWIRRSLGGYRPFTLLKIDDLKATLPALERFRVARVFPRFGQHRDTLYVLLPR